MKLQLFIDLVEKKTANHATFSIPKHCGKCGLSKRMEKKEYIIHIMKKCKNRGHPNNSHLFVYK
jgi:hypothetical protein